VDATTRDLFSKIFVVEPNLRISLTAIKTHKFFSADHNQWQRILTKKVDPPYLPLSADLEKFIDQT
jgi:hypothetical protein